jgi:transcription antitermination factor NusG
MKNPSDKSGSNNLTPHLSDLDDVQRESRVRVLRSMLAATEAKQGEMKRVRQQTLAAGLSVKILTGAKLGAKGVILDADYIRSRVLVELFDVGDTIWISFPDVSPILETDSDDSNSLQSDQ